MARVAFQRERLATSVGVPLLLLESDLLPAGGAAERAVTPKEPATTAPNQPALPQAEVLSHALDERGTRRRGRGTRGCADGVEFPAAG